MAVVFLRTFKELAKELARNQMVALLVTGTGKLAGLRGSGSDEGCTNVLKEYEVELWQIKGHSGHPVRCMRDQRPNVTAPICSDILR